MSDLPATESAGLPCHASGGRRDAILVALSIMLAGAMYLFAGLVLCGMPIAAVVLAVVVVARNPVAEAGAAVARWPARRVIAALLIPLHLWLGLLALACTRARAMSYVGASNLRALGASLHEYHVDFDDYPPDLATPEQTGHCTRAMLVAPYDVNAREAPPDRPQEYVSVIYQPGTGPWQADPRLILIYERDTFSCRASWKWRDAPGRWILFGDGQVRWLHDEEFALARQADAARRRELNWPAP